MLNNKFTFPCGVREWGGSLGWQLHPCGCGTPLLPQPAGFQENPCRAERSPESWLISLPASHISNIHLGHFSTSNLRDENMIQFHLKKKKDAFLLSTSQGPEKLTLPKLENRILQGVYSCVVVVVGDFANMCFISIIQKDYTLKLERSPVIVCQVW